MSGIDDVESPAAWRSYKNNRYASLGAQRILRVLREHFRTHRHDIRREEYFRHYALALFEDLLAAGAFALMHCGVAEENAQATLDRENRRRVAKGLPRLATPEELEAERERLEDEARRIQVDAQRRADAQAAEQRRERRQRQLARLNAIRAGAAARDAEDARNQDAGGDGSGDTGPPNEDVAPGLYESWT